MMNKQATDLSWLCQSSVYGTSESALKKTEEHLFFISQNAA